MFMISTMLKRNGLRPHVVTSEFDTFQILHIRANGFRAPGWAKIMGDALIGGHLKMSGTINFVGIAEPIAVGDNLQFDQCSLPYRTNYAYCS